MQDLHRTETVEVVDRPMSISHFVHTLRAYTPAIVLSLATIALLYVVVAVALYVFTPAKRLTIQPFRLDFEGAAEGHYPNGVKFTPSDITSSPILLAVYQSNHLDRFTRFPTFSRSLYVLEASAEYDRVAAEFQARLADPKLSPADRERILREWQTRAGGVAKNDYSLYWQRSSTERSVPETVAQKVLLDTLSQWARFATSEQRVLRYRISPFAPDVIDNADAGSEPTIAIQVLRSKIYKVLQNIDALGEVPASELLRSKGGLSLAEIRLRLAEIVRFRLEPLAGRVASAGLVTDRVAAVRFLESQLAYDQRQLQAAQDSAETVRQSLAVYTREDRALPATDSSGAAPTASAPADPRKLAAAQEAPAPQTSDSFLDRMVALTSQSTDVLYRQRMVEDYRLAADAVIPAQLAVAYDQEVLSLVRNTPAASGQANADAVRAEIAGTQKEVKELVEQMNDVYLTIARNLNPSKELYTLSAPALMRTDRPRSLGQLALYGIALLVLSLPIIIVVCLVHARMREEDAIEPYAAEAPAV